MSDFLSRFSLIAENWGDGGTPFSYPNMMSRVEPFSLANGLEGCHIIREYTLKGDIRSASENSTLHEGDVVGIGTFANYDTNALIGFLEGMNFVVAHDPKYRRRVVELEGYDVLGAFKNGGEEVS